MLYNPSSNNSINTDNSTGDAFGRLRVSNPKTSFDSKQIYDNPDIANNLEQQPLFYDNQEVSGSGTATAYNPNQASTTLSVSNLTEGRRIRQTRSRFNYQPGKSQLCFMTFVIDSVTQSGIIRREGMFDDDNGLFFEDNGTNYGLVQRSYTSGSAVDLRIEQSNWNVDPMDGTGPSKVDLDFTKTQILAFDYEWLGVGRVRIGFVVDGVLYQAHEFLNTNSISVVYMSTPNLPLRSEISNDGTGPACELTQICSTVISEGGQENLGSIRAAGTAGTHVDCNTQNVWYAILGARLRSSHLGETINFSNVSIQEQAGSKQLEWGLFFNPTVAGTFTYSGVTYSGLEIARGATANTVTGGYQIAGGFLESGGNQAGNAGSISGEVGNAIRLGSLIDGTADQIVLCCKPVGGSTNADIEATIVWQELS